MLKHFALLIFCILISSCSSIKQPQDAIGVYEVTSRKCSGSQSSVEACQQIVLVEFVKGSFYKVANDEVAFVIWSGSEELEYNVRKVHKSIAITSYPQEIFIENDSSYIEAITLLSDTEGTYSYGSPSRLSVLNIKKLSRDEIGKYIKAYPSDE